MEWIRLTNTITIEAYRVRAQLLEAKYIEVALPRVNFSTNSKAHAYILTRQRAKPHTKQTMLQSLKVFVKQNPVDTVQQSEQKWKEAARKSIYENGPA